MAYTYVIAENSTDKNKIQVGNTLSIKLQIKEGYNYLDISSATVKNILVEKPDDTVVTTSASFYTDGTDGIIYISTGSLFFNLDGIYNAQAYIEMDGFTGYSTPVSFTVYPNLPLSNN